MLTLAANHAEAEDSLRYAADVRSGSAARLSNSAHLAYNWLNWAVYNVARGLGYSGGPLHTMQIVSAVLGAVGLALLWLLMRALVPGRTAAFGACGILGCSFGYWFYSGEAEVYVLSVVLLIAALGLAWRAALRPTPARFAAFGAASGLAVLGHNTNVLFGAVALAALLLVRRAIEPRRLLRWGALYVAAAAAVVVPAYAMAAAAQHLSLSEVGPWLRGLSQSGKWGVVAASDVPKAFLGASRALVGGHFVFAVVPRSTASHLAPGKLLREEYFMVRGWSSGAAALLFAPVAVVVAGVVAAIVGWARGRTRIAPSERVLAVLCAAMLCAYVPFFTWWEPANDEFWIAPWLALAILITFGIRRAAGRRAAAVLGAVVVALFVVNLLGAILPLHRSGDDYWRQRVAWYRNHARRGDLIVANGYIWSSYLAYYTPAHVLDVGEPMKAGPAPALAALYRRAAALRPARVLISGNVFHPAGDRFSTCSEVPGYCRTAAALRRALGPAAVPISRAPLETVWRISPPRRASRRGS